MVQGRRSGGLPSAARRPALRYGFEPLGASLSALRSTFPARRPQTEAGKSADAGKVLNSSISDRRISAFPINDWKFRQPFGAAFSKRDENRRQGMSAAVASRLCTPTALASILTRPPPTGFCS